MNSHLSGMILKIDQLNKIGNKKKVLVGGCFDILHIGHLKFLENAKKQGDLLVVLLENDQSVREKKGQNRPINNQKDRARLLAALSVVDFVILLPLMKDSLAYDQLVKKIKPQIIAVTNNDPEEAYKRRAAKLVGAKLVAVIKRISDQSTTKLARLIGK